MLQNMVDRTVRTAIRSPFREDMGDNWRGEDAFVIAEIGKNFIQSEKEETVEENLAKAKLLVDAAVDAGVDAVKFQTHRVEDEQMRTEVVSPHFDGMDRYRWVDRNTRATPVTFWREIADYCSRKNIIFFSTPMSRNAARLLRTINVPFWKVGSGDVMDYLLMDELIATGLPIILSTGMVSLRELDEIIHRVRAKKVPLTVLYCVSKYPCPPEEFNLATITYLRETYPDITVGFSDHSLGHSVTYAAIQLGARVIEKHFSFSRNAWGPDHKASLTPDEMREMVEHIRNGAYREVDTTVYEGDRNRELEGAQNQFRPYFHKGLMAADFIPAGTVLTPDLLIALRPLMLSGALASNNIDTVVGRRTTVDLHPHDPITSAILS